MHKVKMNTVRDMQDAWCRICDHFKLDEGFTMREALAVGFPGLTSNNYWIYGKKLRVLFLKVWQFPEEGEVPHIVCINHFNGTPSRERWVLLSPETKIAIPPFPEEEANV